MNKNLKLNSKSSHKHHTFNSDINLSGGGQINLNNSAALII
jgi:hypothetical protein